MNAIRITLILSAMSLLGACAMTDKEMEDDPAMRFQKYNECAAEQPPEKVAEMCGQYLQAN
ncbi:MAG: hypothetical protein OEQ18_15730 [Gammaproteobacteria bacterium]|nr:hypothetical protein [Gammaproteobacteria bacterium]